MMTRKNNWLLTAVQMGLLAWSGATLAADKVYVANEGADTVSVLDAASFKTLASVRVGKAPHNVQVSPDGKVVWVTNNGEPAQRPTRRSTRRWPKAYDAMGKPGAVWAIDTGLTQSCQGAGWHAPGPCGGVAGGASPTPNGATTRSV